jgi:hypothetical protein
MLAFTVTVSSWHIWLVASLFVMATGIVLIVKNNGLIKGSYILFKIGMLTTFVGIASLVGFTISYTCPSSYAQLETALNTLPLQWKSVLVEMQEYTIASKMAIITDICEKRDLPPMTLRQMETFLRYSHTSGETGAKISELLTKAGMVIVRSPTTQKG